MMIELLKQNMQMEQRQSSKGNQSKWLQDEIWYKADYTGYEGLAEYMISGLLQYSTLDPGEYVRYETEEMRYKYAVYGQQLKFSFGKKEIHGLLEEEKQYPQEIKDRVCEILTERMRKYQYLFLS